MVPLSKSGLRLFRSVGSNPTLSARYIRRGAGVVYQARLESVCSRKVTVGSNPTLSAIPINRK
jgi:hypothetical protein